MKKAILLLVLFLLWGHAHASTQVLHFRAQTNINTTHQLSFSSMNTNFTVAGDTRCGVEAVAGTYHNLYATTNIAPGGAASWTFTLNTSGVDRAVTAQISGANLTASDITHSYTAAAGEVVCIDTVAASSPALAAPGGSIEFTPTTDGETFVIAGTGGLTAPTLNTLGVQGNSTTLDETLTGTLFPEVGTLDQMYIAIAASTGAGTAASWTLRKAAVSDINITTTLTAPATTASALSGATTTDTTSLFDTQTVFTSGSPSAQSGGTGYRWVPGTSGDYPLMSTNGTGATSATRYMYLGGLTNASTLIEASSTTYMDNEFLTLGVCKTRTAPGVGITHTYVVRRNFNSTNMQCVISGTNTTGTFTGGPVQFYQGDTGDIADVPSGGTPAASTFTNVALAGQFGLNNAFGSLNGFAALISGLVTIY